ncbi:MAG: hypothetical protein R3Y18_04260 [Bacillota bacterium]
MKSEIVMKNLIIKTLVVLMILSLFAVSVFMVFFPGKTADICDSLGMTKLSIQFEKVSYDKTGDINTLASILNYEIYSGDNEEICEYGMEMLNHKYYAEYVNFLGANSLTSMSYNVYCETYVLQALYLENMQEEAIAVLSNSISSGYETYGAGIVLCGDVINAGDADFASEMLEIYELHFESASDIKAYNITLEAIMLTESVAESDNSVWQARLETLNDKFA